MRMIRWFQRPWDRCRVDGKAIWTKSGYDICAKHGGCMTSAMGEERA